MRRLFFWRRLNRKQKRYWELAVGAILVVLIPLAVATLRQPDKTEAAWYNDQWLYRKAIPITSASTQTNTQIKVLSNYDLSALVTAGKLQSDLDDIRFTDINGRILKYWIDDVTAASADIWAFVPSIPSSGATIYMYYGNPSVGAGKSTVGTADYPGISCKAITLSGISTSGLYYIDPTGQETSDKYQIYCEMTSNGGGWTTLIVNPAENTTYNPFVDFGSVGVPGNGFYSVWSKRTQITYTEMLLKPSYEALMWATLTTTSPGFFRWTDASGNESTRQAVYATSIGVGRTNEYSTACSGFSPTGAYGMVMYEQPQTWCTPNGAEVGFGLFSGDPRGCHRDGMKWTWGTTPGGNETCPSQGQWKSGYSLVGIRETTVAISQTPVIGTLASEEQSVGPVGYWKFDEGQGTIANDATSGTWKPSDISGLSLWVDADASGSATIANGTVSQWNDLSGNGRHMTQATASKQPTYVSNVLNGKPVIRVAAATYQTLTNSTDFSMPNTVIYLAKQTGGANQRLLNGVANNWLLGYWGGAKQKVYFLGWVTDSSGSPASDTSWHIYSATHTGASQNATAYDNGTQFISNSNGTAGPNGLSLSCQQGGAGECSNGDIAEVIVYNSVLSSENRQRVEAYLANKWGLVSSVPSSNPYLNAPPSKNGSLVGATWTMEDQCISGKCLKFDGTDDYVNTGNNSLTNFSGTAPFTVSAWIKPTTSASDGYIISKFNSAVAGQWILYLNDGNLRFHREVSPYSQTGNTVLQANKWYHVAGVYDGTNKYVYVNGVSDASPQAAGSVASDTNNVLIGADYSSGSPANFFAGFIDEPKIYPYARTAAQIKLDFAQGSAGLSSKQGSSVALGAKTQEYLSEGLVGYWKMDETAANSCSGGANDSCDSSGNILDGAWNGNATSTGGKYGSGVTLDGTGDYVNAGDPANGSLDFPGTGGWTISTWIKTSASSGFIVGKDDNALGRSYNFYITSNHLGFDYFTGATTFNATGSVSSGTWRHAVVTYQYVGTGTSKIRIYIDGALDSSTNTADGPIPATSAPFNIGRRSYSGAETYLNGQLDDMRVYNRALSAKEVSDLYNWAPGPMRYWDFEDGSGGSVTDKSGNANTGTWSGTGSKHWDAGKYGKAPAFNGTDDMITVPGFGSNAPTTEITISFWSKVNESRTTSLFLLNPDDTTSRINFHPCYSNGNTYWDFGNISTTGRLSFSNPANCLIGWHHYSLVNSVQGNYMAVYQDGVRIGYKAGAGTFTNAAADLRIGYMAGYSYFLGSVDDIKIYNYARTQKQIVEDMNGGHPSVGSPVGSAVGYWKFDEGADNKCSGGTNDTCNSGSGGTSLDGALTNAAWTLNGKFGKALSFDGSDYVTVTDSSSLEPSNVTISAWVKTSQSGTDYIGIVDKYTGSTAGYLLDFPSGTNMYPRMKVWTSAGQEVTATKATNDGNWHHLVGTYDGSNCKIYIDGILNNSAGCSGTVTYDSHNFIIGGDGVSTNRLNGSIDEVKLYSYALTADEVKTEYNRGTGLVLGSLSNTSGLTGGSVASNSASAEYCIPGDTSTCSAPVGRWDFEEGSGSTVYDTSGNGKTGTYNGSSTTRFAAGKVGKAGVFNSANTDYVDLGVQSSLTPTNVTLEAWVKANSIGSWNGIISNMPSWGTGFSLQIGSVQKIAAMVSGTYLNSTTTPATNTWYHVVATHDGSSNLNILYINGREENRSTQAVSYSADARTEIGVFYTAPSIPFDGLIDQVRIYNYVRTPAQVAWGYNKGKPVGHWKFDECQGGSANDSSGNSNTGTITIGASGTQTSAGTCTGSADTAWKDGATGKRNASLDLDGTDDYISTSGFTGLTSGGQVTMAVWIKPTLDGTQNIIIDRDIKLRLEINGSNIPNADIGNGTGWCNSSIAGSSALTANQWTHLAVTYDNTTAYMYVNGQRVGTPQSFACTLGNSGDIYIGKYSGGSGFEFPGQIDDVRIFNYALTSTQIKDIMNDGAIRFGPVSGAP